MPRREEAEGKFRVDDLPFTITKIVWKGLGAGKEELQKAWIRPKAEKWIPKELLDRVMASAVQ